MRSVLVGGLVIRDQPLLFDGFNRSFCKILRTWRPIAERIDDSVCNTVIDGKKIYAWRGAKVSVRTMHGVAVEEYH